MPIDNNAASSIPSNSGKPNGKILDFLAKIDLNLPTKKGSKSDSKTNNVDQVMDTKYNTESGPTNPPTVNTEVTVIRKTTKSRKAGGSVISSDNLDDQTNISEPNDSNENSKSSLIPKRNSGKSTVVQNDEINLYSHVVETLSDQPAMLKSFTPDLPEINLENLTESSQADKVKEFVEGSDQPISRQFLENFLNTSVLGDYQSVLEPTVEFSEKHEELPEVSELTELPTQPNLSLSEPSQTESFPLAPDECSLPEANRSDLDIPVSKPERKTEADYNAILLKEISSKRKWFDPINVSAYTNHSTGASSNGENLPLATFPQNQYELDIWSRCEAKVTVVSLTASKNYIAYTDSRKAVHYSVLDRPQLEWKSLKNDERADLMAVSSNGQIVWRLLAGVVWALVRPHRRKPRGQEWVEAASDVVTIAVSNTSGWYVKSTGEVFAQMGLSSSRPRSKEMNVASDHNLVQLSCSTEAVWGLRDNGRISVRIGLSMENPIGLDWVEFWYSS